MRDAPLSALVALLRDAGVTPEPVDLMSVPTYTYTVIPADISSANGARSEVMKRSRRNKWVLVGSIAATLLLLSAQSFAQDAAGAAGAAGGAGANGGNGDYGYKFEDDPLSAGGFGPADATIRVRPGPVRTTLIRPRTSFVPEMLKSVENI